MSIYSFERFNHFGWLDSAAFADGKSLDAFKLGCIAWNHNALRDEREPVLSVPFDAYQDGSFVDAYGALQMRHSFAGWSPVYWPMPFMKRPHCGKIDVRIYGLSESVRAHIQCVTAASPFNPNAKEGDAGVISLLNAATAEYVSAEVKVARGSIEQLSLFSRISIQESLGDDGTYGRNAGTIGPGTDFKVGGDYLMWNFGSPAPADVWRFNNEASYTSTYSRSGHSIVFQTDGGLYLPPKRIEDIWEIGGQGVGYISWRNQEPLAAEEIEMLNRGGTWSIHAQSAFRISSICAYESREII